MINALISIYLIKPKDYANLLIVPLIKRFQTVNVIVKVELIESTEFVEFV